MNLKKYARKEAHKKIIFLHRREAGVGEKRTDVHMVRPNTKGSPSARNKFLLLIFVLAVAGLFMPASHAVIRTKTVEYFALSSDNLIDAAAPSLYSNSFSIYIPENNITIKNAYVIAHVMKQDAGAAGANVISIWLNKTEIANITGLNDREVMRQTQIVNATSGAASVYSITGKPGLHRYNLSISSSTTDNAMAAAKIVITYDYDDQSPIQLKTVKYFINNTNGAIAASGTSRNNFNITLVEAAPNVTSAWFEVTGVSDNSAAGVYTLDLNGTNLPEGAPTFAGLAEQSDWIHYINATASSSLSLYDMRESQKPYYWYITAKPTTNEWAGFSAIAVVTYAYNATATISEQKTVEYFITSNANATAGGVKTSMNSSGTVVVQLPENVTRVRSAFIEFGATTNNSAIIRMNVTINGTPTRTGLNILPNDGTAQAAASSIRMFIDAMPASGSIGPYEIIDNSSRIYNITLHCVAEACYNTWTKLYITYEFNRTGTKKYMETVKQLVLNRSAPQVAAGSGVDALFSAQFAGQRLNVTSSFFTLELQGGTGLAANDICHKLNGTQLPVECDRMTELGSLTYSMYLVKNASATNSGAKLYDITTNNSYRYNYSIRILADTGDGPSAYLTTTYIAEFPSHETNLSAPGAGVTNISFGGSISNTFTATCDATVFTSQSNDVYLILEDNSTNGGTWNQVPIVSGANSHPFTVPNADPASYLCGNVGAGTTCSKSWTVSGNAIRNEVGIRCRSNSTDGAADDSLSQKQAYINVKGGNLTVFISDPVANLSLGIAENRNFTVNVTCASFFCGTINITWQTNDAGADPSANMSALTDLMNTSAALASCADMDVNAICNLTTSINMSLDIGSDTTPAARRYNAVVYLANANVSNNVSSIQNVTIRSGQVNITFVAPMDGFNFTKDVTTTNGIEVNITCMGYNCQNIRALANYSPTGGAVTTTLIPTDTSGNLQVSNPAANSHDNANTECANIKVNGSCLLNWDVRGIAPQNNMPVNVTANSTYWTETRLNYTTTKPLVSVKELILYINLTIPKVNQTIGKTHEFNITCSVNASGMQANAVYIRPQADFGSGFVNISTSDAAGDKLKANASAALCGDIAVSSTPCAANWTLTGRGASANTAFRCYANSTLLNNGSSILYNASIYTGSLAIYWINPPRTEFDIAFNATANISARIECSSYFCGSINWTLHTNDSASYPGYPASSATDVSIYSGSSPYSCGVLDIANCTNNILVRMNIASLAGARRQILVAATSNDSEATPANSTSLTLVGQGGILFRAEARTAAAYDRNQNASVIVLVTNGEGNVVAATTVNVTFFYPNGSVAKIVQALQLETGRYNATYFVSPSDPFGTYRINVNATDGSNTAYTDASFMLRPKLDADQNLTLYNASSIVSRLNSTLMNETNFGNLTIENLLADLNTTRNSLNDLLKRQTDFTQEEIFLVTDSMNTINSVIEQVASGSISQEEADAKLAEIRSSLSKLTGKAVGAAPVLPIANIIIAAGVASGTSAIILVKRGKLKFRRKEKANAEKSNPKARISFSLDSIKSSAKAVQSSVQNPVVGNMQKLSAVSNDAHQKIKLQIGSAWTRAVRQSALFSKKKKLEKQMEKHKQELQSNYLEMRHGRISVDVYDAKRSLVLEQIRTLKLQLEGMENAG